MGRPSSSVVEFVPLFARMQKKTKRYVTVGTILAFVSVTQRAAYLQDCHLISMLMRRPGYSKAIAAV